MTAETPPGTVPQTALARPADRPMGHPDSRPTAVPQGRPTDTAQPSHGASHDPPNGTAPHRPNTPSHTPTGTATETRPTQADETQNGTADGTRPTARNETPRGTGAWSSHGPSKRTLYTLRGVVGLVAASAFVAIWGGWVGLGRLAGFGPVNLLPGIGGGLVVDLSITLPLGIEAYAGIALYVAVSGIVTGGARFFAWCSAIGSLVIGAVGQAAYHLLSLESQPTSAPTPVVIFVSVLPVLVLGLASVLLHLAEKRDTMAVPRRAGKASHSTVPADAADRPTEASHEPRETAPETVPFDRPTPVPHTPNGTSHGTVPTIPVGRLTGPSHETLADRPTEVPQPRPTEPDETPAERPTAARAPRPTNRPKPAAGKPSSRPKTASAKRPTKTSDTPEIEIPDYVPDDWDERKQRVVARFEEARRAGIKMTLGEISRLTEVPKSTVDRYVKEWLESSPEPEATSADSTN